MNARLHQAPVVLHPVAVAVAPAARGAAPLRHLHRERDFGVGYGNSSGYASERRYVSNRPQPLFRFA